MVFFPSFKLVMAVAINLSKEPTLFVAVCIKDDFAVGNNLVTSKTIIDNPGMIVIIVVDDNKVME
jgi:predicted rRNA methylase YqxC with S4 and FtsJ domains